MFRPTEETLTMRMKTLNPQTPTTTLTTRTTLKNTPQPEEEEEEDPAPQPDEVSLVCEAPKSSNINPRPVPQKPSCSNVGSKLKSLPPYLQAQKLMTGILDNRSNAIQHGLRINNQERPPTRRMTGMGSHRRMPSEHELKSYCSPTPPE